jgi:hypothetical protein
MDGKCLPCEKDLDLAEGLIMGDGNECARTVKAPANEKSEKGAKSKEEAEDLENPELNRQIATLVKQPRMIELIQRLKSMEEAAR